MYDLLGVKTSSRLYGELAELQNLHYILHITQLTYKVFQSLQYTMTKYINQKHPCNSLGAIFNNYTQKNFSKWSASLSICIFL